MRSVVERRAWMEGEQGISAARWILVLAGTSVMVGSRVDGGIGMWLINGAAALGASAFVFVQSRLPQFFAERGTDRRTTSLLIQTLDVVLFLGLTLMLSGLLRDASWAVLAIPIVLASLRLGAVGVLAVWLGVSIAYASLERIVIPQLSGEAASVSMMVERAGVLLTIAASLALLTRWLQTGWIEQAMHSEEADHRLANALTIERASRQMRAKTPSEVLDVTAQSVGAMGFEAATITLPGSTDRVVGDGSIIPTLHQVSVSKPGLVELTVWRDPHQTIYSASAFEPRSGATVSGWTPHPPSRGIAEALGDLVAQTSTAIHTASLFEAARYEADHDALTGLANRSRLEREGAELASRAQPVAMMFMDLDRFKQVNDTLGHDEGDRVLRAMGDVIRAELDVNDLPARVGGDEFVAILSGSRAAAATKVAQRIHQSASTWIGSQRLDHLGFGISIGVASAVGPVALDELRVAADEALYAVKRQGRGATAFVDLAQLEDAAPLVVDHAADDAPPVSGAAAATGRSWHAPVAAATNALRLEANPADPQLPPHVSPQTNGSELANASQPLAEPTAGDWRGSPPDPFVAEGVDRYLPEGSGPLVTTTSERVAVSLRDDGNAWPAPTGVMASTRE